MQPNRTTGEYKYTSSTMNQSSTQQSLISESRSNTQSTFRWSSAEQAVTNIVVSGQSDITQLKGLQNILFLLQKEFVQGGSQITFAGAKKDAFEKRLILLQNEIQGLLKRKIDFVPRGEKDRVLDYTGILNEKQNQIVELEKKINNLEERLRKATARETELENQVTRLFQQIKLKDRIISSKNEIILSEVASSNLLKQTLMKTGIQIPNIGSLEIRAENLTSEGAISRTSAYQQLPETKKNKVQLVQLFRQFERTNSAEGISTQEIDKALQAFILSLEGSKWRQSVETRMRRRINEESYNHLKDQFGAAISIIQSTLDRIRTEVPSFKINLDPRIFEMLKEHKINVYKVAGDIIHLQRFSERTIEVPVQDARTKHLLHLLASNLKKLTLKYPKLQSEMDGKLMEFFQQELIDMIEVDEVDKIIEIVKYVPQVVKVENVYAYSSEKSRKVEFHLRVLIKALLQELEKIKKRTGVVLEMDEGVIGMINQEIMGVVDVDDILKIFRVVPKLVEVEKIVEKIVDRIVEVPQVVTVDKITEKIVEVEKIKEVEKVVNVPLQMPVVVTNVVEKIVPVERIVERVIEVPQIIERIIEITKEVPKIVEVERIVEKIVEVEKVIEVEKIVNHIQHEIKQIQVVKEVIIPAQQKIIEKIVEVPVVVQKIVQKVVQVPQVIEVQKIIEKIVPQIQYRNAKQIQNHIEVRYQVVDRIIEKPIPIIQTVEKLVEVPQIVERIVQTNTVVKEPYEVPVIRQKLIVQDRIKEVEVIRDRPVVQTREVVKEVQRIVQIPVLQEKIVKVTQIVEKPIIQRSEQTIIKEVYLRDPQIIMEPKIVEVEKIINHFIEVPKPVKYIEEKIVEVIRHVDRIKEVKVPVEKIIEKMVEVPKVVEVEKIVEKIVVVPRVVEKVVEVPQIVERIVPKIIIQERIVEVERRVEVPVVQERPVEIETVKNVYIQVQKPVQKIVDKLVQVPRYEEKVINNEVIIEKIVEVVKEVPRQIQVEKLVYNTVQVVKPVEIEKQIIVPIQVPIPVEKVIEKIVPVTEVIEKIVQVPQVVEKIVAQRVEQIRVEEVLRVQEKIVVDQRIKEVIKEVPYISEKIKEVVVEKEKIVPIQSIVQQVVTAQQIVEKVVERTITVPKIQQVERTKEIVVEVPKIFQVERIIPQLVNVNRYIEKIVDKIVEVPVIIEKVKEIVREQEKIIEVKNEYETVKQVEKVVEKAVIMEKFKQVVRNINHIEKVLQIVDRYEQSPVPIISHEEKFVEVPYILEKIVEKIVVMPQIVEVLKYVHEVVEEQTLGVAVGVQVATHEQKYKLLTQNLKSNIGLLLVEIKKLRSTSPALGAQVQIIEKFLAELEQFILFPRIVQVPKETIVEKIVEKDKIVQIPTQDERSIKMQLTLSLLVQKLILELKKIKKTNPSLNLELEDDIKLIFFPELEQYTRSVGDDFNVKLKQFSDSIYRKFESLGNWSYDHQLMLNTFLQERFMMANLVKTANTEIERTKSLELKKEQELNTLSLQFNAVRGLVDKLRGLTLVGASMEESTLVRSILTQFDQVKESVVVGQPMRQLSGLEVSDARIKSLIREKDAEIQILKDQIIKIQTSRTITSSEGQGEIIRVLQMENLKLKNEINDLRLSKGSEELNKENQKEIKRLQGIILQLENEKSELSAQLFNLKNEYEVMSQMSKKLGATNVRSEMKSEMSSPVNTYDLMRSPSPKITLVESQITKNEPVAQSSNTSVQNSIQSVKDNRTSADNSRVSGTGFSATYSQFGNQNLTSSMTSSVREGMTSSNQYVAQNLTDSSRLKQEESSSTIYQSGYSKVQGSGVQQYQGTYQAGTTGTTGTSGFGASYQLSSGYQPGSYTPSVYQQGTSSSLSSSIQSGSYQPSTLQGQYQPSTLGTSTYQTSTSSAFQGGYQPTSGYYGATSSTFKSGFQPPKPADKK